MPERKTVMVEEGDRRAVIVREEQQIMVPLDGMAAALVAAIGEENVGRFDPFWQNGDALEVSFRRVRKTGNATKKGHG